MLLATSAWSSRLLRAARPDSGCRSCLYLVAPEELTFRRLCGQGKARQHPVTLPTADSRLIFIKHFQAGVVTNRLRNFSLSLFLRDSLQWTWVQLVFSFGVLLSQILLMLLFKILKW